MAAALPSLVLALLCLQRAGAQLPVQPDLDTEKVNVLPGTSCPGWRGCLGQGACAAPTPEHLPAPPLS